jgi:quercetin dioxygenase-like cupin family protein
MSKIKHSPQATRFLRLPFDFDVSALQQDLQRLQNVQNPVWLNHYNNTAHQKRWACLPLRSLGGSTQDIFAQNEGNFLDTPLLAACPYFQQVLASFACETTSVRLMSMAAGGRILPHTDPGGGFEDGVARLHIPIITDPLVVFCIDGETIHFSAGHTWYMNANCTHAVDNASAIERIHLVIDCIPNDWLKQVFIDAGWQQNPPPKYGDPNITDDNVAGIIAALSSSDNTQALQLAEQLTIIQARHST